MKYLKYFETRETPKEVLDLFSDRIQNIDLDNELKMSVERTKGSYKIIIINKLTNKTIARLYIQSIKEKNGKYTAEVRRVHVNDEYREKGLGSKLMQKVIDVFGDFNLYLYPSPNRIKDLSDTNREEYRNRLVNFYGKYGFKKVGDTNRMERFNESMYRFLNDKYYLPAVHDEKYKKYQDFIDKKLREEASSIYRGTSECVIFKYFSKDENFFVIWLSLIGDLINKKELDALTNFFKGYDDWDVGKNNRSRSQYDHVQFLLTLTEKEAEKFFGELDLQLDAKNYNL